MKITFVKPLVPNYIKVKELDTMVPVESLNDDEIKKYTELWIETFRENIRKKKRK